jgi:hypothetical protein
MPGGGQEPRQPGLGGGQAGFDFVEDLLFARGQRRHGLLLRPSR